MKRKNVIKILIGLGSFVLLIKLVTIVIVEPRIREKILTAINENNNGYVVALGRVHILLFSSGIDLKNITISSRKEPGFRSLYGEIASIKLKGINLVKALIRKDIDIKNVTISESIINGKVSFSREAIPPVVLPLNIRIKRIFLNRINLSIGNTLNAESYTVKEGYLKVSDLEFKKLDTLSPGILNHYNMDVEEFILVSPDSMYQYKLNWLLYSTTSNTLAITEFSIHPNYEDYEFTSRYAFQKVRLEAVLSNIHIYNFSISDYFRSQSIKSSGVEIGKLELNAFRDKRKAFRHVNKPIFQDMISNYPGIIHIDSITILSGNILYKEHAEEANEPGSITFNDINSRIYNIANDSIYKTKSKFLKIKVNAMFLGKSKLTVLINSIIFDRNNTFSMNGTLSKMEANEMNPILEKNAFIYITSGVLEDMKFNFTADNTKSSGKMTLLYSGLNISVKNKHTDDTTAFREKVISIFANIKVLDSNPISGEKTREGIIDYERDPERFLLSYCFKSIMSGMRSSIIQSQKK